MSTSMPRELFWSAWCLIIVAGLAATACARTDGQGTEASEPTRAPGLGDPASSNDEDATEESIAADVLAVRVTGTDGSYTFAVTLSSPDTGCEQYADWWEVLTRGGDLVHRRILMHSHVNEQPFTRSGGPVDVDEAVELVVRAHMNNAGYAGIAFAGSIASGFEPDLALSTALAPELASAPPQPNGCAF